ncbi:protein RETICULATA-RELATED 3, chloroplastic-like [Impatiens glandulifera]|uniref:protein RETICULATA-RELATED 3, chloroplastic-like n=1 Tax=Impatiens glandulifera TaxID=253017 RepID=UPI001FB0BEAC|nr:protein RETICULATA-RELATED 3, chloroplastic-like [Impatiens glandulifera]
MAMAAQLLHAPILGQQKQQQVNNHLIGNRSISNLLQSRSFPSSSSSSSVFPMRIGLLNPTSFNKFHFSCASVGGGGIGGKSGAGGGGGGGGGDGDSSDDSSSPSWVGPVGAFVNGWRSRVAADPQFPFKVLMEELVGVSANVFGDMASRPNFGLNELDFVFSTLVVGSIVNFVLMYLLAPTISVSPQSLPGLFSNCPTSHMFEPGAYSLASRLGTFVYKGTIFAGVGFAAGLVGTVISNLLIKMRKKMDPNFESANKGPPTVLNALTWAMHMGFSSNLRYQSLNGIEFMMEKNFSAVIFKSSVVLLRCLNNIVGGMTFVMLARLTGSQSVDGGKKMKVAEEDEGIVVVEEDDEIGRPLVTK